MRLPRGFVCACLMAVAATACGGRVDEPTATSEQATKGGTIVTDDDPSGRISTYVAGGTVDTTNPFFQSLGTNGRACRSCHVQSCGWTLTPAIAQARFDATQGTDPLFSAVDGAVSPNADVSTLEARRSAYALLLTKGLIRVGLPIPTGAEFALVAVDDPYGFAGAAQLSLFRRPLPAANLPFLTTVMWDGRESNPDRTLAGDLAQQAIDATLGHAQAAVTPTAAQVQAIVAFETSLFTAQSVDAAAGDLTAAQGGGGPVALSQQSFFAGINDPFGGNPQGTPFTPDAMTLYPWDAGSPANPGSTEGARAAVARGQKIFDERTFTVSGVGGLNDLLGQPQITATCTTCHDAPNVGDHSRPLALDIGIAGAARRTPDLPLYTLQNLATGATVQTTDPGRALVTGKWADIGKFKGPILRGLPARAPYFHNGSAATLNDVVSFYDARFSIGLSAQDQADLVAFLRTL
jgi:cytochrome c peroxidase